MSENDELTNDDDIPTLAGYVSVKEAAKLLHVTDKMVYAYIQQKRLRAEKISHYIVIPLSAIENFEAKAAGRERTTVPLWRVSKTDNTLLVTWITVYIRSSKHNELLRRFERIRKNKEHDFPGTVARYIIGAEQKPDELEILLIWKQGIMPAEDEREQALAAFRHTLADVLDWDSAHYRHDKVYMHT